MSEVIGSVQVVVRPDTKGFAEKARDGIEREFRRKNVLEIDFESDPDELIGDLKDSLKIAQKYLDLKKNKLKVDVGLDWRKGDIAMDLKRFKTDVETLEKLYRPTVYADFEVDRKGMEAIKKDVKLNVTLDTKALERAISKGTKDVSIFGDKKTLEKKTRKAAELASATFQDIFSRRKLKLEIDADTKKLEQAQVAMEKALGIAGSRKAQLADLEDSLASVTKEIQKQTSLTERLNVEWLELEESGEANARQFSYYANELRDAEDSLKGLVREQDKLRMNRDHYANNIVDPSISGADRLRREFDELERDLEGRKIELSAVADRSSFAAVSAELHALTRDRLTVIYTKIHKSGLGIMERQWASISKHSSNLATNSVKWLGQLTGIRVMWHTFKDMVEWLPKLDMMVPQLASKVALFGTGTAGAIGGLGVLVNLLSDVAEVGKSALFLPTLLAGTAGSAVILGRAFVDFKKTFPEIIQFYKDLGNVVSDKVWEKAAAPMRALHDATKGLLTNYVPQWASAWGEALGALTTGIGSGTSLRALEDFLQNSIDGTENATKGWESLGSAIMAMIGAGSSVLPDLGTWFSDIMGDFDKWAKTNTKNGNIERWTREGATALRELGSVMVSTVKIFGNLSGAFKAAGFPGLTELAAGMKSLAESTRELSENGEFMFTLTAVRDFFKTIGDVAGESLEEALNNAWLMIGRSLNRLSKPIADVLDGIFDGFNSDKFQHGFETFIDGMGSFLEDIAPGLESLTSDIGTLLGVVGTAGESWGPAFNDMLLMFSSAGDELHPGLIDFIENTGPALQDLVQDITPYIEDFAGAISDLLGNENFQEFVSDMIGSLGTLIGWLMRLGTGIVRLAEDFADWYGSLSQGGQDTVRWAGIMAAAFGGVALAIGGLALKIAPGATLRLLGRGLGAIVKGAGRFVATFVRSIAGLGLLVRDAVRGLFRLPAVKAVLAPVGRFFAGLGPALLRLLPKGLRNALARGLARILPAGGFRLAARFAITRFIGILAGPAGWALLIASVIKPLSIADFAGWVLEGLGLDDTWAGRFVDSLSESIAGYIGDGSLIDWVLQPFKDAWGHFSEGDWIAGIIDIVSLGGLKHASMLAAAITEALGFDELAAALREGDITAVISDALSDFGNTITDALGEAWDALVEFVKKWNPISVSFRLFEWLAEKVFGWLGIGGDSFSGSGSSSQWGSSLLDSGGAGNWGQSAFDGSVEPWLNEGWTSLLGKIFGWFPKTVFNILSWIGSKLGGWLNGAAEGVASAGKGLIGGVGGVVDWGAKKWTDDVKPWLDSGWETLKGNVENWNPNGDSGMGSAIDRALGTDAAGVEGTKANFEKLGGALGGFAKTVVGKYGEMGNGGRREIEGLADTTDIEFGNMQDSGTTKTNSMSGSVVGNMLGMKAGGMSQLASLASGSSSKFSSMKSGASSKSGSMKSDVVSNMGSMQTQAVAKAAAMQVDVIRKMSSMKSGSTAQASGMQSSVVSKARHMQAQFVAQMTTMARLALGVASRLRGSLVSALSINANGAGRFTGSTFVSGLAGGLSRAVSVAYSIRGRIRSALSFSAYGSGTAIGGTFASGIRSRVGAVASAANALARAARARMPNSPADEGPFSGNGWGGWGESIADELARGLKMGAPAVAKEAEKLMGGVGSALGASHQIAVSPDVGAIRGALQSDAEVTGAPASAGNVINVNVESHAEDPLQDGRRLGGDLSFALKGAGF